MMTLKPRHQRADFIATASMADIAFLLIVFFMVTTVFQIKQGMTMKLPKDESGTTRDEIGIFIEILPNEVNISGEPISIGNLLSTLIQAEALNTKKYVILKADDDVTYERFVLVLDVIMQAGISDIALPSKEELDGLVNAGIARKGAIIGNSLP